LGAAIDRQIATTVTPLAIGYFAYTTVAVLVVMAMIPKKEITEIDDT